MTAARSDRSRAAAAPSPREKALDRLALLAIAFAIVPIPILGIGHPATHGLVLLVVALFFGIAGRPANSIGAALRALDLGFPEARARYRWIGILLAAAVSAVARWILDVSLLGGGGGIRFYEDLLRQHGVIGPEGTARWALLAASAPVLLLVILLDGIFFSGLIQSRVEVHTNLHTAVLLQALLFCLPHTFVGSTPDVAYGVGTFLAGAAYGYVYRAFRNHWIPATMLGVHVIAVWAILLSRLPRPL